LSNRPHARPRRSGFCAGDSPAEDLPPTAFGKRSRGAVERITAGGGRSAECRACLSGGEWCRDGDPESSRRPLAHPPLHQPAAGRPGYGLPSDRVHVCPQQFGLRDIRALHHRRIAKKASTLGIETKVPLRGGIEYEPDALLATPWRFRLLSVPVGLAAVRMGDVEKRKRPESLFAGSRQSLVDPAWWPGSGR